MRFLISAFILLNSVSVFSQSHQPTASEIKLRFKKLNFLGSALYVAAHPDDENTRVIAYLSNDRLAATAYLSMTRGDGGQNLIGSEIRDLLGLIRTQELLAARRIDGGEQFFTRANDFGFSKNQQETFAIWDKPSILSDVVKIFRQYQPDVILTRFPPDERAGHGHHTASAILAQEAFDLSGKSDYMPEQAKKIGLWQPKRLFTNTGRWWNQTINETTPGVVTLNVGTYNALLGESYSEMAARSRTQHKSQGFGSPGRRGDAPEYFEFVKGEVAQKDIFDGVNTTWSRLKGGERIQPIVIKAIQDFREENPSLSIPVLLKIRTEIATLDDSVWKRRKLLEVNQLIQDCAGLFMEATANHFYAVPGEKVLTSFEMINRSSTDIKLTSLQSEMLTFDSSFVRELKPNQLITFKTEKEVHKNLTYSGPYWLKQPHSEGLFKVDDPSLIGLPENKSAISFDASIVINNETLKINVPLRYKWTDPVKGELFRPVEVTPPLFLNLDSRVYLFKDTSPKDIRVLVKSASPSKLNGTVKLQLAEGWRCEPALQPIEFNRNGEEQALTFKVFPVHKVGNELLKAVAEVNGRQFSKSIETIQYDHIPIQTILPEAESKVVRLDLKKEGGVIGYIKGAGDEIPASLRNMGYEVWEMKDEEVTMANLKKVDAVVLGIRALNTNERIRFTMPDLLSYVQAGGTMIVQYNTNFDLEIDATKFSPYPITLSRDRVTEENGEVRILKPDHPILNYPNKIGSKDFDGWVQERGLYYPSSWDSNFEAILSSNDAGEKPKDGGLLVAKYGSGYYVYTSLSFFRELPEGVSGAYKLFSNLVSLGKPKKIENIKVKKNTK